MYFVILTWPGLMRSMLALSRDSFEESPRWQEESRRLDAQSPRARRAQGFHRIGFLRAAERHAEEPSGAGAVLGEGEDEARDDDGDRDEHVRHRAAEARQNHLKRPVPGHGRARRRRAGLGGTRDDDGERENGTSPARPNDSAHRMPPVQRE